MTGFTSALWIVPTVFLVYKILQFGRREPGLPVGPPTIPILGNAHLIPAKGLYIKFKDWADKYGPIYSLKIGRTTMVVLCDREAVFELLSRRGAYYNDRPQDRQVDIALGHENTALMGEGPLWRAERKIISTYLTPKNLDSVLAPIQVAEVSQLMIDLLEKPESFRDCVKRTTASISTITLFGHRAPDLDTYWGHAAYLGIDEVNKSLAPGSYLPVDHIPILKLIPDRWNKPTQVAKNSYLTMSNIWAVAREQVEERRRKGDKRVSMLDRLLDGAFKCDVAFSYSQINNFFGAVHMGASDTTSGHTLASILFLAKYPEYQEKARKELDHVCGADRMPQWSDFNDLPYVNCIVKEGLRFRAALPTGIAHCSKHDYWYKGMLIPKDSMIMVPPSAINFDERYIKDANTYNPDRHLKIAHKLAPELAASSHFDERDHYTYGVGRRICPGFHLAERVQWRIIAQLLWAFRIEPLEDLSVEPEMWEEGFLNFVKEFKVRFVPISGKHAEMVRAQFKKNEEFLGQWV